MARSTVTLRVGALLYHGTDAEEDFRELSDLSWVSNQAKAAEWFAGWNGQGGPRRLLTFRVAAPLRLRRFRDAGEIEDFVEKERGERSWDTQELAELVCARGFDGWRIDDNYGPGAHDILLCDPARGLSFVRERGLPPGRD